MKTGNLTALIARSADFYGPRARTGIPNVLVFDKLAKGAKATWLVNDSRKHSFTFTPDAAKSLALLVDTEHAWNQTWHVPTAPDPPAGKEFIEFVANEFGTQPKLPRSEPADALGGGPVRYNHPGIIRDALSVRIPLYIRLDEIHEGVPFSADSSRRRRKQNSPSRPTIEVHARAFKRLGTSQIRIRSFWL